MNSQRDFQKNLGQNNQPPSIVSSSAAAVNIEISRLCVSRLSVSIYLTSICLSIWASAIYLSKYNIYLSLSFLSVYQTAFLPVIWRQLVCTTNKWINITNFINLEKTQRILIFLFTFFVVYCVEFGFRVIRGGEG